MSLTFGSGPFSKSPRRGAVNFPLGDVAPPHQMFWQPDERLLRAVVGDIVVLDTTRARLLHETAVVPRVYAPLEDFRRDLLVWSRTTTHCPWKGDAWLVEEDRVLAELRDPYHRVDAHPSTRLAVATIDGEEVARSQRPMLVFETGVRTRVYFPRKDFADPSLVAPGSGKRTTCQYKGEASYWNVAGVQDVAWGYEQPLPDAQRVQSHLSFDESHPAVRVTLAAA